MIYMSSIQFPSDDAESGFIYFDVKMKSTAYNTHYPFRTLAINGLQRIEFDPITILYGGNGSGKSTALNVIAEKIKAKRKSVFNKTNFYPDYLKMCTVDMRAITPAEIRIITSDDVFDYMLNIRNLNEGIDERREEIFEEYLDAKYSKFQMRSMADYEQLKKVVKSRSKTQSAYTRSEIMGNIRELSNGESAFMYFTEKIGENSLYILDEPENSLSPKRQMELAGFLQDSVRFYGCQIIMSTHSPFLLSMQAAKVYNLDENPAAVRKWTELENVRAYYDFFELHKNEFA